ncbi:MAG: hypothetical protein V8R52_02485 [Coprobacter fastidiosus]
MERYFLEAEAALRWNIGSLTSSYLRGIVANFADFDVAQTDEEFWTYWAQKDGDIDTSIDYVDPSNPRNNIKGLLTVGVTINSSDAPADKIGKDHHSKMACEFPDGT